MKNKYKNFEIAFSSKKEIKSIQEELLREHLVYCTGSSPYYGKLLRKYSLDIADFCLEDLKKIPFTDKVQLIEYNDEFLVADEEDIVDLALSSGTTGVPVKIKYTENDLKRLAYNEKKSFEGCGITKEDTVLLTCTMDRCFIAGLAYFMGCREVGAASIRNGLSSIESHLELIQKLNPTVIVGVPSFLLRMGKHIEKTQDECLKNSVKKLVCIGEPVRNYDFSLSELGIKLSEVWNADLFSTYASSEGVSTFCECREGKGGHLHPDLAVLEIIDDNGNCLEPGEIGEIVLTPLGCTGMPLIRFKTGDISFIDDSQCECGRKSPRLGPILGRKKQMLKIKGTTVYPQAVYSVLDRIDKISGYYVEVSESNRLSDWVEIYLSLKDDSLTVQEIENLLKAKLRVRIPVYLKDEEEIVKKVFNSNSRKLRKFFDNRKIGKPEK